MLPWARTRNEAVEAATKAGDGEAPKAATAATRAGEDRGGAVGQEAGREQAVPTPPHGG